MPRCSDEAALDSRGHLASFSGLFQWFFVYVTRARHSSKYNFETERLRHSGEPISGTLEPRIASYIDVFLGIASAS